MILGFTIALHSKQYTQKEVQRWFGLNLGLIRYHTEKYVLHTVGTEIF